MHVEQPAMTLVEMLEGNAKAFPSKTAVIYRDAGITYGELNTAVNRLAHTLISLGIRKGDRVGFMLPRTPALVISFLSIAKAQGIAAPINFELFEDKIRSILIRIAPKCLIVHKQFLELAQKSIPEDSKILLILADETGGECYFSFDGMPHRGSLDNLPLTADGNDVVYLNYTSGSTGSAKGAVTTHSNIYWNTAASIKALHLTPDDIHLCMFAPFAHPHEIFARPLYLGGTIVMVDKIYPKSIAEAISKHRVTCMMGLAPLYETLLEMLEHKSYDISSLRIPESGGMFTKTELIERFRQKTGVPILPVWGSTETTGIAIANTPGEPIEHGSAGKACISYEIKIVDEHGEELPDGDIGEMIFKGPAVVSGYYEDSINTAMCLKNGWYYSGDLGRKDGAGNYYFVDRKSGMMKIAGLKVYPLEIELTLMEHPDIKEAAVISVNDKLRGEIPKAFIVAKNGKKLTADEIVDFCKERLPNYKLPRLVQIQESLPKIGSGKINKRILQMEEV